MLEYFECVGTAAAADDDDDDAGESLHSGWLSFICQL